MALLRSHKDVSFPKKSGEMAILRVSKGVRLLRKREEMTIVRLRSGQGLGKTWIMGIMRE